ncbi:MAG TPA: DUF4349 domain-containing protein [Candidatus Xenobia bacterium]|nr:DUF4349 domain-containing protein [Candidatus Xenobia bacterium]
MVNHVVEPEELQAYLDGELGAARRAEVETHLRTCAECSAVVRDLQQVTQTLQRWQVEPAPATLRPPEVDELRVAIRWTWPRLVLAFGGTTAVLLLALAVSIPNLLTSRMASPEQPPLNATAPQSAPSPPPTGGEQPRDNRAAAKPSQEIRERDAHLSREMARRQAAAGPAEGRQDNRLYEDKSEALDTAARPAAAPPPPSVAGALAAQKRANAEEVRRLIAYNVAMAIEVKEFGPAKAKLLQAVEKSGGYVSEASTAETPGQPQRADYTLRVPAEKLPALLADLRHLGRVQNEQLSTDEVTEQVVDLDARLRNARNTEQRLIAVLNERTGKVKDILEVEREIARTREEIERMDAQRVNLMNRVQLATVQVALLEEFKAQLQPTPIGTWTRLNNAFVDGYEDFVGTFVGLALFFARHGLSLLFWLVLLYFAWRRLKPRLLRLVGAMQ